MSYLHSLITDHIRNLSGVEFKIAAYLYRRLERQKQVSENIHAIATATGLSWRQTQSALRKLAEKGVLQVDSVKHLGTRCRLPDAVTAKHPQSARKPTPAVVGKSPQMPAE